MTHDHVVLRVSVVFSRMPGATSCPGAQLGQERGPKIIISGFPFYQPMASPNMEWTYSLVLSHRFFFGWFPSLFFLCRFLLICVLLLFSPVFKWGFLLHS